MQNAQCPSLILKALDRKPGRDCFIARRLIDQCGIFVQRRGQRIVYPKREQSVLRVRGIRDAVQFTAGHDGIERTFRLVDNGNVFFNHEVIQLPDTLVEHGI